MAKVKVHGGEPPGEESSPSKAIVASARQRVTKKDETGRDITTRKLNALERLKIMEMLGASTSNEMYFGHVMLACSVCEIDGEPVPIPRSKLQAEALVARLDDPGLAAAGEGVKEIAGFDIDDNGNVVRTAKN